VGIHASGLVVGEFSYAAEIIDRLHSATLSALRSKVAQAQLSALGAGTNRLTPEEFDAVVRREYESNREIAKAAGISLNSYLGGSMASVGSAGRALAARLRSTSVASRPATAFP